MTLLYLVDNSVLQRVHRSEAVRQALLDLLNSGTLASCLPQRLEEGFSARNLQDFREITRLAAQARVFLPPEPAVADIAISLQDKLFAAGMGRAVGVSDLQIAATALHHSRDGQQVMIVHYDSDFDHLAAIEPALRTNWIVPQGSVP
ncbi:MAG: PIN domain-containing protein [Propionibacteriaceae bacterium]|jgi:predicted nucleic acid-binding protein|nr:PIN domain-containing protein [Propionibacteriaceae bacterium]